MKGKAKTRPGDIFQRITTIYIYLMLSVFILWPGTGGFEGIQSAKYTLFLILCGGYIAVMLICAAELLLVGELKLLSPKLMFKRSSWVQRFVLAYMLLTWISALISGYFPETVLGVSRCEGALTITIYCLCFLLVSCYGRVIRGMLLTFSAAVCLFALLSIIQLLGGNLFGMYPEGLSYMDAYTKYSGAYLGTIGNVDLVASFLCIAIPILWIALLRWKSRERLLLLIPLALALFVLIRMSVMAGFVGVFVGAAVCLPFVLPASKRTRIAVGLGIVALGAAALIVLRVFDFKMELLHQLHEILNGRLDESFGSGRIRIWKDVLEKVPSHILFGYGPDTMMYGGIEAFTRYDAELGGTIVSQIDIAHNEYLNILYHQGVLALAAYLAALVSGFVRFIRTVRYDNTVTALGGAVICYSIQAFFGLGMCIVSPLFWLAFALLEKQMKVTEERTEEKICGRN